MRWLIGLASIAIIAFVAYFFWGEWTRTAAPVTPTPIESATVTDPAECKRRAANLVGSNDEEVAYLRQCIEEGHLSPADIPGAAG